jgi:RNA polymerase sigma-70 factor (ECF subfamily)
MRAIHIAEMVAFADDEETKSSRTGASASPMSDFPAAEGASTDGVDARSREAVERARAGDESAWRELFEEHYPRLFRFFRSRVDTEATAEDLAAETFTEAVRSLGRFQWRNRPFGAWLFGIARNRLRMHYRSRKTHEELPEEIGHSRDDYVEVDVRDALERLEPDHRVAIELRYLLGLSGEEAAAVMGRSHGAFRALLHRATQSFKREYGNP